MPFGSLLFASINFLLKRELEVPDANHLGIYALTNMLKDLTVGDNYEEFRLQFDLFWPSCMGGRGYTDADQPK